jgi:hypothetical protein
VPQFARLAGALQSFFGCCPQKFSNASLSVFSLMPPSKKTFRDRAAILNGRLASPKKAIKRVAAIALSPVKARPQKKHQNDDPEDHEVRLIFLPCRAQ